MEPSALKETLDGPAGAPQDQSLLPRRRLEQTNRPVGGPSGDERAVGAETESVDVAGLVGKFDDRVPVDIQASIRLPQGVASSARAGSKTGCPSTPAWIVVLISPRRQSQTLTQ